MKPSVVQRDDSVVDSGHARAPEKLDAQFFGAIDHRLMQVDAPHRNAGFPAKVGRNPAAVANETNAAKRERVFRIELDSQATECAERVRHEPFAAGFVDGRLRSVRDGDVESLEPRCDRRRQPRGSAADHENIR